MRLIVGSLVALSLGLSAQASGTYHEPDLQVAADGEVTTTDQYPRVSALEKAVLGQTFPGDELAARLARMESKAFGSASASDDLGDRTDKLEQYAEQKLHKKLFKPGPQYEAESATDDQSPDDGQTPAVQSDYPRIVALEQAILGQSYPGEPPADRLSRMESKAFGSPSTSDDLSERTENLQRYAEKKLHKNVTPPDAQGGTGQRGSQLPRQLLSILGGALLGVPGLGSVGAAPQAPPEEQQAARPREDDALVHAPTPPPPGTRLITQVAWCEVQIFGRTYPELHLPIRLEQLNNELNFKPGKPGLQLMDDIAALIQAVQAKAPPKSIGATPEPPAN